MRIFAPRTAFCRVFKASVTRDTTYSGIALLMASASSMNRAWNLSVRSFHER